MLFVVFQIILFFIIYELGNFMKFFKPICITDLYEVGFEGFINSYFDEIIKLILIVFFVNVIVFISFHIIEKKKRYSNEYEQIREALKYAVYIKMTLNGFILFYIEFVIAGFLAIVFHKSIDNYAVIAIAISAIVFIISSLFVVFLYYKKCHKFFLIIFLELTFELRWIAINLFLLPFYWLCLSAGLLSIIIADKLILAGLNAVLAIIISIIGGIAITIIAFEIFSPTANSGSSSNKYDKDPVEEGYRDRAELKDAVFEGIFNEVYYDESSNTLSDYHGGEKVNVVEKNDYYYVGDNGHIYPRKSKRYNNFDDNE